MGIAEDALQLVQSIYDVTLGSESWPSVIRKISTATGGHSGLLRLVDYRRADVSFVSAYGYTQETINNYRQYFIRLDPYSDHLAAAPAGSLLQSEQVAPVALRKHTAYFNDYERPEDRTYALGCPLGREQDFLLYLGLSRGRQAGPYDDTTLQLVQHLLPHMLRSVQLQRLVGNTVEARNLSEAALDQLRVGVILLSSDGRICFTNQLASSLAESFRIEFGESGLRLPSPQTNDQLQQLIAKALNTDPLALRCPGGDMTYSRPGLGILQFRVFGMLSRHDTHLTGRRPRVAIFLVRPGPPRLDAGQLATQFQLTPAESRLAVKLAEGTTVNDAARLTGISVATARTHLRNIFAKTATSRQSELALLILTSLAGISIAAPNHDEPQ